MEDATSSSWGVRRAVRRPRRGAHRSRSRARCLGLCLPLSSLFLLQRGREHAHFCCVAVALHAVLPLRATVFNCGGMCTVQECENTRTLRFCIRSSISLSLEALSMGFASPKGFDCTQKEQACPSVPSFADHEISAVHQDLLLNMAAKVSDG